MKPVKRETDRPPQNLPYRDINQPFRFQFVIPGNGIVIEQDANGICYISTSGVSPDELVAGDNIEITRKDGKVVISAVDSVTDIAAGQNVTIDIDPETGTAIINSIIGGADNEHYKGVFDTAQDLIAYDTDPELGDYGLVKNVTYSDGGEVTWNGQYKYCFYINGQWTVVDQMLTFTKNRDLLQQFYSVGGSSPVIYLHEIARTGNFEDLDNIARVATPVATQDQTGVILSCDTDGAEIFYTIDGSTPYPWGQNASKYTGPLTFDGRTTIRAVAVRNGMINSEECTYSTGTGYNAPVIELDHRTGVVTISHDNPGSYTMLRWKVGDDAWNSQDGSSVSFTITEKTTISAYVTNDDQIRVYSPTTTRTFEKVKTPRMMFGTTYNYRTDNGAYVCTCDTPESEMHYTDDGETTPDWQSPVTTGTIRYDHIYEDRNIKVMAIAVDMVPSDVFDGTWGLGTPDAPVINYDPDTMLVTIDRRGSSPDHFGNTLGLDDWLYEIRYTTDGSTPTPDSNLYTGPFTPENSGTVKAYLIAYGAYYSDVSSQAVEVLEAPTSVLEYTTGMVALHNPNNTGKIHYTTDGSTPTADSTEYTGAFLLTEDTTIKMIVVQGAGSSAVATKTYTKAAAPYYYSSNDNYLTGTTDIVFGSRTPGAVIHYTTDGSTPTYLSSLYTDPVRFSLFGGERFDAITLAPEYIPSSVSSGEFADKPDIPDIVLDDQAGQLAFRLQGNTTQVPLQTNNNTPTLGSRIYYTLDGSDPSENGILWDGVGIKYGGEDVKAVTVCYGDYYSDIAEYSEIGKEPLFIEAKGLDGAKISQNGINIYIVSTLPDAPDIQYSLDEQETWNDMFPSVKASVKAAPAGHTSVTVSLTEVGQRVYFRGVNERLAEVNEYGDIESFTQFKVTGGRVYAGGNVQSLVDGIGQSREAICMAYLFEQCYAMQTPPALPATTLAEGCYYYMFNGCSSLTQAPALPATTLAEGCYNEMFSGCTSLTQAPALPATTLALDCYYEMFSGCTSLTQAPALPATRLYPHCYVGMFNGCSSLTQVPALPATTLAERCYSGMFSECSSLTQAPALPATTLAEGCYNGMFYGCTSLTQAPALPATTLALDCYQYMFNDCSSLTQAPALPATTLAEGCYYYMFNDCSSLTQAPALPATRLYPYCYDGMFDNCIFEMSSDGTTFNFSVGATLPQTVGGATYATPLDLAIWMGNENGFD